jgi:hypothetical protein
MKPRISQPNPAARRASPTRCLLATSAPTKAGDSTTSSTTPDLVTSVGPTPERGRAARQTQLTERRRHPRLYDLLNVPRRAQRTARERYDSGSH